MPAKPSPNQTADPVIAALLLAAGLSRRMGGVNKLLVEVDGEPMVRRAARTLRDSGLGVTAVTGHEREKVERALAGLDVRLVFNPDYRDGQYSSVRAGLASVTRDADAILVALADQPSLEPDDIAALLDAFRNSDREKFVVPWFEGRRGNPVVMPRALAEALVERLHEAPDGPPTDLFPGQTTRFEAPNDHFIRDIDTLESLSDLGQHRR